MAKFMALHPLQQFLKSSKNVNVFKILLLFTNGVNNPIPWLIIGGLRKFSYLAKLNFK